MTDSRGRPWLIVAMAFVAVGIAVLAWIASPTSDVPAESGAAPTAGAPTNEERELESGERKGVEPREPGREPWRIPPDLMSDPVFRSGFGSVRGRLVDEQGGPLAGLEVEVVDITAVRIGYGEGASDLEWPWLRSNSSSDQRGRFVIDGLHDHAHPRLTVRGDGRVYQTPAQAWSELGRVLPGGTLDLGEIVVPRSCVVAGRVLDPEGEPIAGALVHAQASEIEIREAARIYTPVGRAAVSRTKTGFEVGCFDGAGSLSPLVLTASTDSNGRFRIAGVPAGRNEITVHARGTYVPFGRGVECRPGEIHALGDLRVPAGRTIRCRVLDAEQRPVPDAEVIVAGATRPVFGLEFHQGVRVESSRKNGLFVVGGYPGDEVTLAARRPGGPWSVLFDVAVAETNTIELAPSLELRLTAAGASPSGVQWEVRALDDAKGRLGIAGYAFLDIDARSNRSETGRLVVRGLAAGKYVVRARSGEKSARAEVELTESKDLQLELEPTRYLEVEVVDSADQPIRNVRVDIDNVDLRWTDESGKARFDTTGLSSGTISCVYPGFEFVYRELENPAGTLRVRLLRYCIVEGRIVVPAGRPRFSAWEIGFDSEAQPEWIDDFDVKFDDDGRFEVVLPRPGAYAVMFVHDGADRSPEFGLRNGGTTFQVREGRQSLEVLVDWTPPRVKARLRGVVTLNGKPAKGLQVENTLAARLESSETKTDANGSFDLGSVYRDRFSVAVEGALGQTLWSATFRTRPAMPELRIDIVTGTVSGRVLATDGNPAAGVKVLAWGEMPAEHAERPARSWRSTETAADGTFSFRSLPAAQYEFSARQEGAKGKVDVRVRGGGEIADLAIRMQKLVTLKGRVHLDGLRIAPLREDPPPGLGKRRLRLRLQGPSTQTAKLKDGAFEIGELLPGRYAVDLEIVVMGPLLEPIRIRHPETLVIPAGGSSPVDLVFGENCLELLRKQAKAKGFKTVDDYLASMLTGGAKRK